MTILTSRLTKREFIAVMLAQRSPGLKTRRAIFCPCWKIAVNRKRQRSEVRGRKSEIRSQRSEVRGQESEKRELFPVYSQIPFTIHDSPFTVCGLRFTVSLTSDF